MKKSAIIFVICIILAILAGILIWQLYFQSNRSTDYIENLSDNTASVDATGLEMIDLDDTQTISECEAEPAKEYSAYNLSLLNEQKDIESSYVTDFFNGFNHFWIDENGILWGTGYNEYGQLGGGAELELIMHSTPVKIAENVIHISCDTNHRFLLFLTSDHKLYGLGSNCESVLLEKTLVDEQYNPQMNTVSEPKLLMENIYYVSAGMGHVCVLTDDGDAYWWGRILVTTATYYDYNSAWSYITYEPKLMVENAKYVIAGPSCAAAIDNDNNLWMWGNNTWGQCGVEAEDDWIWEPVMVRENVEMVWLENLTTFENTLDTSNWLKGDSYMNPLNNYDYFYTTFIRTVQGDMMACGIDLPGERKTVEEFGDICLLPGETLEDSEIGDIEDFFTHDYSPEFLPITIK